MNIEQILLQEPHVIEIKHSPYTQLPRVDGSCFEENRRTQSQQVINVLERYLKAPCIIDDFDNNHAKRRDWLDTLREKYGKELRNFYATNCLRINKIVAVKLNLELFFLTRLPYKDKTEQNTFVQLTEAVVDACTSEKPYTEKTTPEKLSMVANIKETAYKLLTFLAQKPAQQTSEQTRLYMSGA